MTAREKGGLLDVVSGGPQALGLRAAVIDLTKTEPVDSTVIAHI